MVKASVDCLAEAFAEEMLERVRKEFWAYSSEENLESKPLHQIKYTGIRPAPGYPSQPDHTEKETMWKILKPDLIVINLTESLAMDPAASVSGLYLAHPKAVYFSTGKLSQDQIVDYAGRKGVSTETMER